MSIAFQNIKIGLERNGETKFLTDITEQDGRISYQLSEQGQTLQNPEATRVITLLRQNEPDNNFIVLEA